MLYEYIIPKTRYYTYLAENAPYQTWESDRITLKRPSGLPNGDRVSLRYVNSFIQFKLNKPVPPTSILGVYGGLISSYGAIQAVVSADTISKPQLLGVEGVDGFFGDVIVIPGGPYPPPEVASGPPPPDYNGTFNVVTLLQNQTFANIGQNAFYRLSFALGQGFAPTTPFALDVTISGAIVASD
jgi:hypothetical protein